MTLGDSRQAVYHRAPPPESHKLSMKDVSSQEKMERKEEQSVPGVNRSQLAAEQDTGAGRGWGDSQGTL